MQPRDAVASWSVGRNDRISLLDVIFNAKPTALIGVSGQARAFTESVVHAMAKHNAAADHLSAVQSGHPAPKPRPPTSSAGAKAAPSSAPAVPFPPLKRNGRLMSVDQTNNSYIFPGVGLGVIATQARRITDTMFMAAAKALAELSPAKTDANANLLPPVTALREVAIAVAIAVGQQALSEGLTSGVSAGDDRSRGRRQDVDAALPAVQARRRQYVRPPPRTCASLKPRPLPERASGCSLRKCRNAMNNSAACFTRPASSAL